MNPAAIHVPRAHTDTATLAHRNSSKNRTETNQRNKENGEPISSEEKSYSQDTIGRSRFALWIPDCSRTRMMLCCHFCSSGVLHSWNQLSKYIFISQHCGLLLTTPIMSTRKIGAPPSSDESPLATRMKLSRRRPKNGYERTSDRPVPDVQIGCRLQKRHRASRLRFPASGTHHYFAGTLTLLLRKRWAQIAIIWRCKRFTEKEPINEYYFI